MKLKTLSDRNEFKPIELSLTIETKRELEFLLFFIGSLSDECMIEIANRGRHIMSYSVDEFSLKDAPLGRIYPDLLNIAEPYLNKKIR